METTRLRSARTVSTLRSPRGPRLIVLPPLSRMVVTRPRLSNFAVVPRVVVTPRVLPLLSRSTTVPLARVVRVNTFFLPFDLPLPESLGPPAFTVLPGWSAGLVDEPRPGRTFRGGLELSNASAGAGDRPGLFVSGLFAELPVEDPPCAGLPFHGLLRAGFSVTGAAWSPTFAEDAGCAGVFAEEPRPACTLRDGRGAAVPDSDEGPERPGLLFPLPCGAGLSSGASGDSCADSVEDADRLGALAAGPRHPRGGFDEPSSVPLPERFAEPDRSTAFADEPREPPAPAFVLLLPRGGPTSCRSDPR